MSLSLVDLEFFGQAGCLIAESPALADWLNSYDPLWNDGCSEVCAAQTSIPQIECEALVAVYNATDGDNWTSSVGWLDDPNVCNWWGVTCTDEHITELALSSNQLSGTIPPELGNLTDLQGLYLYNNQLTGTIPPELGNLTNLWYLVLGDNQLTGTIPAELGDLTNLQQLYLSNNQLSGTVPDALMSLSLFSLEFFGQTGCLVAESPALADWLNSYDPMWNDGCSL